MKDKIRKNSLNLVSITMRQKINLLITVFSISLLFLSSCEKEIYDDAIYKSQQPQNLSISKISFKELKSNKKAVQKIKNVMTKKLPSSLSQRAVYNEDFGVLIDTTNIVQMVSETEQSLTFNIVDYTDSTKKENLILVSKDDGSFEAYIAEYNLTQQDLDILASGGTLENLQPTNISEIENASKIAVSGSCVMTSTYTVGMCENANGGIIENNGNLGNDCVGNWFDVEYQVISIDYSCISQGGGSLFTGSGISSESSVSGSNSSSGNGYGGGSGYNGSFSGNYINTTFVSCSTCPEFSLEFEEFLETLDADQLAIWNDLLPKTQQEIIEYLEQNNYSSDSLDDVYFILDYENDGLIDDEIVIIGPDIPIYNMEDYLSCFDRSQGARITIYADQPKSNTHNLYSSNDGVGHAFFSIQQGSEISTLGFYPVSSMGSLFGATSGIFGNDQNHTYDVSISISINSSSLNEIFDMLILTSNPIYDLHQYNCTDVAVVISNFAGINIPSCESPSTWNGDTPGTMGQIIRNMTISSNITRNVSGGNSPSNNCN